MTNCSPTLVLPEILNLDLAAGHMGVQREDIDKLVATGALPARRIAGRWLTTRRALLAFIERAAISHEGRSDA